MATTRRELIGTAGAAAAWASLAGWARARDPLIRGGKFSQGVAAGWPLAHGALLWTRSTTSSARGA